MRISIRVKILISFLICSMIAMLVAMGGTYWRFKKSMTDNVSGEISNLLSERRDNINTLLKKVGDCGELIGINEIVMKSAYLDNSNSIEYQYNLKMFSREISNIYELSLGTEYGEYGLNFYVNKNLPIASTILESTFVENTTASSGVYSAKGLDDSDWYKETIKKNGELHMFTGQSKGVIFIARKILFLNPVTNDNYLGVSVVGIDFKSVLYAMEKRAIADGMSFVISYNGEGIIAESSDLPDEIDISSLLKDREVNSFSTKETRMNDYLVHAAKTDNGIKFFSFTPIANVTELALENKSIIIVPVLITLFLLVFMSLFLSFVLNRPLGNLVTQLDTLGGADISKLELKKVKNDEVGDLYYAINSLIDRVNTLVNEAEISARREKALEIKMHQMKITPHFLYNTLDSIFWKAEMAGETEIASMVSNLSSIFEYSIRGEELTAPLSDEVAILESYVEIQRKRFSGNIEFFYDIATAEDIEIPKNILQPLVENSIIHGMEQGKDIEIFLWAQTDGSKLQISVQDNGKGNCADELNAYLSGETNILENGKIGVSNVNKRLSFIYGEGSGLRYENNPEGGLTVTLSIILNETGG